MGVGELGIHLENDKINIQMKFKLSAVIVF